MPKEPVDPKQDPVQPRGQGCAQISYEQFLSMPCQAKEALWAHVAICDVDRWPQWKGLTFCEDEKE